MNLPDIETIDERHLFDLVERLDVRGPRYTSYPTAPVWRSDFNADHYPAVLQRLGSGNKPVAVYLHLPYCKLRCFYCGCNSFITSDVTRMRSYADSLIKEIKFTAEQAAGGLRHAWLHLGGGTPTHQPVEMLAEILDAVIEYIPGTDDCERSIEVDPRVTTIEHLKMLYSRGFRRISAGLQDVDAAVQKAVNRVYTFEQMHAFVELCREVGFTSVNIDLIYGLPKQTRDTWKRSLEQVATLRPDRVAAFGYAHLPAKIKHQQGIHEEDLPSPQDRLGMLLDANRSFRALGYVTIGLDHFSVPEDKLSIARNNGKLWRNFMGYTDIRGLEMIGFGASSIGELDEMFVQNQTLPDDYKKAIETGFAINRGHLLTDDDRIRKLIINELMCNLTVRIPDSAKSLLNGGYAELETAMKSLQTYVDEGLIVPDSDGYTVTSVGQLFLRNLAMPFDRYLPNQTGVTFSRTV